MINAPNVCGIRYALLTFRNIKVGVTIVIKVGPNRTITPRIRVVIPIRVITVDSKINGLVVTSPWLELTKPPSKIALYAVSILSNILPGLLRSNGLNPEDLSRDLRVVHAYKNDELVHDRIGIKLFTQIYEAGIKASMSIYKINVPLVLSDTNHN